MRSILSSGLLTLLFVVALVLPEASLAAADNQIGAIDKAVCAVIDVLSGNVARGVAAFGIIFLGFSLFLGKISWGTGLALAIGLGAVLGAGDIVKLIAGGTNELDCASFNGA